MRLATQFAIDGLMSGAIYSLLALGFSILWSSMRVVSLAHPSILAIGAAVGVAAAPAGFVVALLAAAAVGAAAGVVSYYSAIKPLVQRSMLELMVATLGLGIIAEEVLAKIVGPDSRATPDLLPSGSWIIAGFFVRKKALIVLMISLAMLVAAFVMLRRSKMGIAFRVTAWAPEIGAAHGVNIEAVRVFSIAFASMYAGIAGLMVANLAGSLDPFMGFNLALPALIAMLIGGAGNIVGAAVGGLLLGVLEGISAISISGPMSQMLEFALLLLVMVLRPQGLLRNK